MNDTGTSLIERDASQGLLWSDDQVPAEVAAFEAQEGHYSGSRLFLRKPEVYRTIVYLLGCGVPIYKISEALKVHHKTVAAVAVAESGSIAQQKRERAAMARQGQAMILDSLIDDIAKGVKIPAKDKAIILGILTDTAEKLDSGSAFDGADFDGSTPGHEEYQQFLDGLTEAERSALQKMGRAAEKRSAKEQAAKPVVEAKYTMDQEAD